ncbi:hypothetical protein ABZS89_43980, partial [Streptomyces sp. NPDC005407]
AAVAEAAGDENPVDVAELLLRQPQYKEVCGRSAISGIHNQQSVGGRFSTFLKDMRITDKDAYWLDTRMTESCVYDDALGRPIEPVICKMTAK